MSYPLELAASCFAENVDLKNRKSVNKWFALINPCYASSDEESAIINLILFKERMHYEYLHFSENLKTRAYKPEYVIGPWLMAFCFENRGKSKELDALIEAANKHFTDEEFSAFAEKVSDFCHKNYASKVKDYDVAEALLEEKNLYEFAAAMMLIQYRIDELSDSGVRILLSNEYTRDEKFEKCAEINFIIMLYGRILGTLGYSAENERYWSGIQCSACYFNGRIEFIGGIVDLCYHNKTGMAKCFDLMYAIFLNRKNGYDDISPVTDAIFSCYKNRLGYDESIRLSRASDTEKIYGFVNILNNQIQECKNELKKYEINKFDISLDSYLPFTAEQIDDNMSFADSRGERDCVLRFIELINMLAVCDTIINFIAVNRDHFADEHIEDAYDELKDARSNILKLIFLSPNRILDNFLKSTDMEKIEEAENRLDECNRLLDVIFQNTLSTDITDIGTYMQAQKTFKKYIADKKIESLFLEKKAELINDLMCEKIMAAQEDKPNDNNTVIRMQLKETGVPVDYVPEMAITQLACGESLFDIYVSGAQKTEEFDFSCIAIMYYKALEGLLSKLLYIDYLNCCGLIKDGKSKRYNEATANKLNKIYFAEQLKLITHKKGKTEFSFPDFCTLGSFKYYINENTLNGKGASEELKKYITKRLCISDIDGLIKLCEKVSKIATQRNNAAHGLKTVSLDDVIGARKTTYLGELETLSGLIIEFLELLGK